MSRTEDSSCHRDELMQRCPTSLTRPPPPQRSPLRPLPSASQPPQALKAITANIAFNPIALPNAQQQQQQQQRKSIRLSRQFSTKDRCPSRSQSRTPLAIRFNLYGGGQGVWSRDVTPKQVESMQMAFDCQSHCASISKWY